jgi:alkanesulfonate monooxygenase SsuD/methylene tetrahydromethanopterin reductase-like flavin-dependent oxidoreductase (luciferase family)
MPRSRRSSASAAGAEAVKFGILASHQFPRDSSAARGIAETIEFVRTARDLGYDSVFTINHFLGNLLTPQTISMTARLIDHSGSMTLGTGILILPLFHPVHVAEEFATLDQLSGGRIVLGVGTGYRKEEFDSFQVDHETRGGRLGEGVRLIRRLWSDERVDFEGKFYTVQGKRIGVPPLQPGGPKIWIGAGARPAIERAAKIGDAWFTPGNSPSPEYLPKHVRIYDDALRAAGKPVEGIERPIIKEMFVHPDGDYARQLALEYLGREYAAYGEYEALDWFKSRWHELVENSLIVGDPDTVVAKVRAVAAHGFNHFVFRSFWGGMPIALAQECLRTFAEQVRPRLLAAGVAA